MEESLKLTMITSDNGCSAHTINNPRVHDAKNLGNVEGLPFREEDLRMARMV
jgi:hypothetical protein